MFTRPLKLLQRHGTPWGARDWLPLFPGSGFLSRLYIMRRGEWLPPQKESLGLPARPFADFKSTKSVMGPHIVLPTAEFPCQVWQAVSVTQSSCQLKLSILELWRLIFSPCPIPGLGPQTC